MGRPDVGSCNPNPMTKEASTKRMTFSWTKKLKKKKRMTLRKETP